MRAGPPPLITSSVILTAGLFLAVVSGLVFHLMVARALGPADYGALTASVTYVALWAVLMEGGVSLALTREAAADPRRLSWAPRLLLWKSWLALTGVAGALTSAWLLGFDSRVLVLVAIMALGMVGFSGMRLAFGVFRAIGSFAWEAGLSTLQKGAVVLLAAAALRLGTGVVGVAAAFTLSYAIGAGLALRRAWRAVSPARDLPSDVDRPPAGFFFWTCIPLFASELLSNLYVKLDQIMLLRLRGPEETGLYAAAYRIVEALLLVVAGAMTVLFPRLAGSARGAPGPFAADFARAWRTLWIGGLALAVNGWLWAVSLLPIVFGGAYASAEAPLRILLASIPLAYVNALLTQSLVAKGRERRYAAGAALCAGVNLGLNLLLIPPWGATGAAWATIATEGVLLVICFYSLRELGPIIPLAPSLATGAGAALAVAVGWWALPDRPVERGLLAFAVSVASWEAAAPWPLRKLWAAVRQRAP